MNTQQTLSELLDAYANGHPTRTALYLDLAARLSDVAHKAPPWKPDYIQAVAAGTLAASRKFARAVDVLAAAFDGTPVAIADTEPVTIYARPGTVHPGALFVGESRPCAYGPCNVKFIPAVPWQKYCPIHKNPRNRK